MTAYLDHAATTPMRPAAVAAMADQLAHYGNPSSLHGVGRARRRTVEESREQIAEALGVLPSEIIFTGGGTEADNLAVKGLYWSRRRESEVRRRILTSGAEHHAVLDSAGWLAAEQGAELELLGVDEHGRVDPAELDERIGRAPDTVALVSLMTANNEVGTVQPIAELAQVAAGHGVPLHTDAVQAVGQLPLDLSELGADAVSISAHKLGGPVGAGALVMRRGLEPVPVLHGGGQERDVRSGTVDTLGIAGFAAAVVDAVDGRAKLAERLVGLRDDLLERVRAEVPDVRLGGHPTERLPGNLHLTFPGCEGDSLLLLLDAAGVACSTGSACSSGVAQPSHVLSAMGYDDRSARSALRFSFGHTSTEADVDAVAGSIGPAVERARAAGYTAAV